MAKELRVLHVTPYYEDAWAYGGIPRATSTLVRSLERRGHRITVCTTDACDASTRLPAPAGTRRFQPFPPSIPSPGIELRVFPNVSNRLAYRVLLQAPLGLSTFVSAHAGDFDIAHLHGCHNLPSAVAARVLRRGGVPYVLQPHGTAPRIERRKTAKLLFDLTVGRGLLSGADRVVAVSNAERRQIEALGVNGSRIDVIPNPVNVEEFEAAREPHAFRRSLGLHDERIVLYLGTLTPRKNVDVLVRAFAVLRCPDARLVIAGNDLGSGPRIRALVAELGLDTVTTFTGLLERRQRLEALADADVLVYPARDEVFGLVPIEALLAGTPAIVADDCGCGDVIRHVGGGLVCRTGDVDGTALAIRSILKAPQTFQTEVACAQRRIRVSYDPMSIAERVESLYQAVLSSRTARRTA